MSNTLHAKELHGVYIFNVCLIINTCVATFACSCSDLLTISVWLVTVICAMSVWQCSYAYRRNIHCVKAIFWVLCIEERN